MRLLLDTHAALWWLSEDERLSDDALDALIDDRNELLLSAVVVWEVAMQRSLGKVRTPEDVRRVLDADVRALPISLEHAAASESLEWHHRDPFDRMLVAQAKVEGAAIVSRDAALQPYGVPLVW